MPTFPNFVRRCAFVITTATALSPGHAEPLSAIVRDGAPHWIWVRRLAPPRPITLDLIRADVSIVASKDSETRIEMIARGKADDTQRVWIDVADTGDAIRIQDRFPQRSPWALFGHECQPPSGERGDFWVVPVVIQVVVHAPPGARIEVTQREGKTIDRRGERRILAPPADRSPSLFS